MVTFGQKGVKMSSKTSPFCVLLFFSQRKRESAEPPNPKRVVTRDPVVICLWKQKEATPSISWGKWTLWKEWLTFLHMQKHVFKSVKKRHLFVFCSFFPKENLDRFFGKFPKQWRHKKRKKRVAFSSENEKIVLRFFRQKMRFYKKGVVFDKCALF